MKNAILLLLLAIFLPMATYCQTIQRTGFVISSFDQSNKLFFSRNKDISSLDFSLRKDVISVEIRFKDNTNSSTPRQFFVLSFDGDKHLFRKKYGDLILPTIPNLRFHFIDGTNKTALQKSFYEVFTAVTPDSVSHRYSYYTYQGELKFAFHSGRHVPLLRSDINTLKRSIEQQYKAINKIKRKDSILIFAGSVDKKGKLSSVKLVEGKESRLANSLIEVINQENTLWWPVIRGDKLQEWPVRIAITKTVNDSITVSIL